MTFRRGRRADTVAGQRMIWLSICGRYRIERSSVPALPVIWRACRLVEDRWEMLSRHRTRRGAERACASASPLMSR